MKVLASEDRARAGRPKPSDILLIEDDVLQAHELEAYFTRKGFTVMKVMAGSASLHNVAAIRPRVVIVDYHLPDMDGMTVATRVRRLAPHAAVVLVSGRIDFVAAEVLDRLGVVAFLRKPVSLRHLRSLVSRLIKNPSLTRKQLSLPLAGLFASRR